MEFVAFNKIPRLSREVVITEKIDGTNASIFIETVPGKEEVIFLTGSRTRWITPEDDNHGFAKWAAANKDDLMLLGPGHHFGEWWGQGIQRNYGQATKRFSLFNTHRWGDGSETPRPVCCDVVPVLYAGQLELAGNMLGVNAALNHLRDLGSMAAPGFMNAEGIVIYHPAAKQLFKKTLEGDEKPKGSKEVS